MSVFALDAFDEDNDAGSPLNRARTAGAVGAKVVLLGECRSGKTCLARALLGEVPGAAGGGGLGMVDGGLDATGGAGGACSGPGGGGVAGGGIGASACPSGAVGGSASGLPGDAAGPYVTTVGVEVTPATVMVAPRRASTPLLGLTLWDVTGNDAFAPSREAFYRDAHVLVLVFDMTNRASFAALGDWLDEAYLFISTCAVLVAGNKSDLAVRRVVSADEARAFAASIGGHYVETCAATGDNVARLVRHVAGAVLDVCGLAPLHSSDTAVLVATTTAGAGAVSGRGPGALAAGDGDALSASRPASRESVLTPPGDSGLDSRPLSRIAMFSGQRSPGVLGSGELEFSSDDELMSSDDGQYVTVVRRSAGGGGGCIVL
ncbi:rab family GTPase [Thecamonas trahens ATCC 50062]|uniref:Rab family GTPase n=1 Tax=Thecamonas trahens ATCC 50062 TaxID=461836 RepID=A0A0L0DAC6_THETB|nr:rab family GTPase [Thecamonas trahens ATCC 50062]KNC48248.1 rab family GTPase [Thecamonas trahens ATCC 50062]|eukprot:XP_013758817.1 rab family GTPase [Thecamonas trahens ATCC 50062]